MNIFEAIRCKRTSRKLSAFLDLQSGAQLTKKQIAAMTSHLSRCHKCSTKLREFAEMKGALAIFGRSLSQESARLESIRAKISQLLEGLDP